MHNTNDDVYNTVTVILLIETPELGVLLSPRTRVHAAPTDLCVTFPLPPSKYPYFLTIAVPTRKPSFRQDRFAVNKGLLND